MPPVAALEPLPRTSRRSPLVGLLDRGCRLAERVGFLHLDLDGDQLITAARCQTGLEDFGGDEFREPLHRLLESCRKEARLNAMGLLAVRHDVGQLLVNRLHLTQARTAHPAIVERRIEQPLFITGLPRTGTTLLHNLLAEDPAHRAPMTWEAMFPTAPPGEAAAERIAKARRDIRWLHRFAPGFRAIHSVEAELPQECVVLMSHSFLSDQFDTMYRVPSYVAWLEERDLKPAYEWHRRILQHLQEEPPKGRWVLKAPAHLQSLGALLECYPDARVVQTHREPTEVLASLASLTTLLRSIFSDAVDRAEIGRELSVYWARVLEHFQAVRETCPRDQFLDVTFAELKKAPIAVIRRIYAWLGCEFTAEAEARMRSFLAAHPRREHGTHRYSLGQFGLEFRTEHPRFARYRSRFTPTARSAVSGVDGGD